MSRSPTITEPDPDWLYNEHAGEILAAEFLEPYGLTATELAGQVGSEPDRLKAIIAGHARISAEIDLRLTRYFGLSEGFFLRLQDSYELLEAKRALAGALDRIVPRAA